LTSLLRNIFVIREGIMPHNIVYLVSINIHTKRRY